MPVEPNATAVGIALLAGAVGVIALDRLLAALNATADRAVGLVADGDGREE
ncbi:MAG: hypothetical protein ABEJ79_12610 [Halolamina sp.]